MAAEISELVSVVESLNVEFQVDQAISSDTRARQASEWILDPCDSWGPCPIIFIQIWPRRNEGASGRGGRAEQLS